MLSISRSVELEFREHSLLLSNFEESHSLYSLVNMKPPVPTSSLSITHLFSKLSISEPANPHKPLIRALKASVRLWNTRLDADIEKSRSDYESLYELKQITSPLLHKVELLSQAILDMGIKNQTLTDEIARLKGLLERVKLIPEPVNPYFTPLIGRISLSFNRTRFLNARSDALMDRIMNDCFQREKEKREIRCTIHKLCRNTHQSGEGWEQKVIDSFKELNDLEIIKSLGEEISSAQVLQILLYIINNREHEQKLPYLLGSLPFNTFGEVVLSLDPGELAALNRIFKGVKPEEKEWLETQITKQRDSFIEVLNHLKEQIDTLCHDFRLDSRGTYLNEGDINNINELTSEVNLRKEQITKLEILYGDITQEAETKHLITQGFKKDSKTLWSRLTEKEEYPDRPAGNVWGIIYRNVFETNQLHDTDEAYNILAAWSVCSDDDYRRIGLLGKISDTEFEQLKKDRQVYAHSVENLAKLGIRTIADWKSHNIFNQGMLSRFLDRHKI